MIKYLFLLPVFSFVLFSQSCNTKQSSGKRESVFNDHWKFYRGEVTDGEVVTLNDSAWRTVHVPHDFSIEDLPEKEGGKQIGPFSKESPGGISTGHTVGGTAWYRKHFKLNPGDEGKIIKILFDGIYMNSDVWINGHHLGNHPYGYTAFVYNLTEYLHPAPEENVIAVRVRNEGKNSRWYSGSGIYRNVTLIKTEPVHVDLWGIYITTPKVSKEKAVVKIELSLQNEDPKEKGIEVIAEVKNASGNIIAKSETQTNIPPQESSAVFFEIEIPNPDLWSPDSPNLYSAEIILSENGKVDDLATELFGVRSIEFSAEEGFLLNGKNTLLKGACLHHDNGILGSAAFASAERRKIQIMKKNGYNAIRTAHNPPSKNLLDACDELGMLVIDESFDQWQRPKNPDDYNMYFDDWWERDMESMLLRDRNHPSVIIWSFGNEINERADSSGVAIAKKLIDKIRELDPSRPATQAVCNFWEFPGRPWEDTEPAFSMLDVHGYNYMWQQYEKDHTLFPERIMIGTESFALDAFENWQAVEKFPWVIGDFVWTGMDYFGESGIGFSRYLDTSEEKWEGLPPWPWYNAFCGDIDITGNKKAPSYYRDVLWGESSLELAVHEPIPQGMYEHARNWGWPNEYQSWNWEGHEGETFHVNVYARGDSVRMELNGMSIGTKPVSEDSKLTAAFDVPYEAGKLTAIAWFDGKETDRKMLTTTGKSYQLKITPEKDTVFADPDDLAYFNVEVLDETGLLVPNASVPVEFVLSGNGTLQAVGNADPTDMHSFQQPFVNTFQGRCQIIIRSCDDAKQIGVTAASPGLQGDQAVVYAISKEKEM